MEWNAKWNWENLIMFGSRASESSMKLQLAECGAGDGGFNLGSFNFSGSGGKTESSFSDGGHGSSTKSSVSASTDSSLKEGMRTSNITSETFEGSPGNTSKKVEPLGSVEPLICLKLGKRTYFENNSSGSNAKSPSRSVVPTASATTMKKSKSSFHGLSIPRCQVEGCNLDLSSSKEYHRKHRVCDGHSKSPKVIVGGVERRFCQQCSRFHSLSEFDEKKRSCRKRLSDHNARRRKPLQETIQFSSTRSSSFYDSRKQMNFVLDNPLTHSKTAPSSTWDTTYSSKFTLTRGFPSKPQNSGSINGHPHMSGSQLQPASNLSDGFSGLTPCQGISFGVMNQGVKDSILSSNLDAALESPRALSLLSINTWASCEPESIVLDQPLHVNNTAMTEQAMHAIPQGVPLASSEYWQTDLQSSNAHVHSFGANSNNCSSSNEIQLFKAPFETDFYFNMLD